MGGLLVAMVGGGAVLAGTIVVGRWLGGGRDKESMREARDAQNAKRIRSGDAEGDIGVGGVGNVWPG